MDLKPIYLDTNFDIIIVIKIILKVLKNKLDLSH
jgi:hypothetical protein